MDIFYEGWGGGGAKKFFFARLQVLAASWDIGLVRPWSYWAFMGTAVNVGFHQIPSTDPLSFNTNIERIKRAFAINRVQ